MYRIVWWELTGKEAFEQQERYTGSRNHAEYLTESLHRRGITNAWMQWMPGLALPWRTGP